jgi:hypothetical protein
MTDWGASNRKDEYQFFLCDPFTMSEEGEVAADAASSSLSWDMGSETVYSGTIALLEDVGRDKLIRVKRTVSTPMETVTETVATMFVRDVSKNALYGMEVITANCFSTLYRLTEDKLPSDFHRSKNDKTVVEAVKALVEGVGGKLVVDEGVDTAKKFGRNIWFTLGDSRYMAASTIASWIGCKLTCDGNGNVVMSPKERPDTAPVKFDFEAGRNCVYVPGVGDDMGQVGTANRVVAYFTRKKADDDFPLSDRVVVELGDECEFSYARCGRYQTAILKVDPCSHADLEKQADDHLMEKSGEVRHYTIEHVSIPGLTVGDVVTYRNDTDFKAPVFARCQIEQMDVGSLSHASMCKTKLKRIL